MERERAKVERELNRENAPMPWLKGPGVPIITVFLLAAIVVGIIYDVGQIVGATIFASIVCLAYIGQFRGSRRNGRSPEKVDEQRFLQWARENEYETTPTDYDLIQLLEPLGIFGQYRPVFIGVRGEREGLPFWIGRLTIFNDGLGGETQALLDDMVAVYRLPYRFDDVLLVEPTEASHTLLRDFFNLPTVPFESEEFNAAYTAHSDTPSFAHACVTPLVMEELLRWPNMELLLRSGLLVVNAADNDHLSRIGAERLEGLANAFLATLPSYLKQEGEA